MKEIKLKKNNIYIFETKDKKVVSVIQVLPPNK